MLGSWNLAALKPSAGEAGVRHYGLRVAQSDAGIGLSLVLPGQLKEEPLRAMRCVSDLCNKAQTFRSKPQHNDTDG